MNNELLEVDPILYEAAEKAEIPRTQSPVFASDWFSFIQDHFQTS